MYEVRKTEIKSYVVHGFEGGKDNHLDVTILKHPNYPNEKIARLNDSAYLTLSEAREVVKILEKENGVKVKK